MESPSTEWSSISAAPKRTRKSRCVKHWQAYRATASDSRRRCVQPDTGPSHAVHCWVTASTSRFLCAHALDSHNSMFRLCRFLMRSLLCPASHWMETRSGRPGRGAQGDKGTCLSRAEGEMLQKVGLRIQYSKITWIGRTRGSLSVSRYAAAHLSPCKSHTTHLEGIDIMLRVSSAVAAPRTAADPGVRYLRWNIPVVRSGTLKIESGSLQLHSRGGPQRPGLLTRKRSVVLYPRSIALVF